jgi:hypothetical protein
MLLQPTTHNALGSLEIQFRSESLLNFVCDIDTAQVVFPNPKRPYLAPAMDSISEFLEPSFVASSISRGVPVGGKIPEDNERNNNSEPEVPCK